MAFFFFMDESGQDQRESPYEVLAGVAIEDRKLWPLIQDIQQAEKNAFGSRFKCKTHSELKAKNLLKRKTFRLAAQMPALDDEVRKKFATKCITDGSSSGRLELTALAQAKLLFVRNVFDICLKYDCKVFASIVGDIAQRPSRKCPKCAMLRKDYAFLFERYFYFLEDNPEFHRGIVVFDELEKTQSHILLGQMDTYFQRSQKGRERSGRLIPEPFFVHSDLTSGVRIADFVAYIVSWGFRRISEMIKPAREELAEFAEMVSTLRYKTSREDDNGRKFVSWSFVYVPELCEFLEQERNGGDLIKPRMSCSHNPEVRGLPVVK